MRSSAAACLLVLVVGCTDGDRSAQNAPGLISLFAGQQTTSLQRDANGLVHLRGVFLKSTGGNFEVRVSYPQDRASPQLVATLVGADHNSGLLSADMLDGWSGLGAFLEVTLEDADGKVVLDERRTFCPNGLPRQRVDDTGPIDPLYPRECGARGPNVGSVWGVERGWAVEVFDPARDVGLELADGSYELRVALSEQAQRALSMRATSAATTLIVGTPSGGAGASTADQPETSDGEQLVAGPSLTTQRQVDGGAIPTGDPPDDALPDLVSVAPWNIVTGRAADGQDELRFSTTIWNLGHGPFWLEGFRPSDGTKMKAFQYFVSEEDSLVKAPVDAAFRLDERDDHRHWHAQAMARYSLVDEAGREVAAAEKASFCIANVEPVDLTLPDAIWNPSGRGLAGACGGRGSIWTRQVLDVGWGDVYDQDTDGQAIDVTAVPNGIYRVRIEVNPDRRFHELATTNNVSETEIRLTGSPGQRDLTLILRAEDLEPTAGDDP